MWMPSAISASVFLCAFTPYFFKVPLRCSCTAQFRAVCPPKAAKSPSGRTFSMTSGMLHTSDAQTILDILQFLSVSFCFRPLFHHFIHLFMFSPGHLCHKFRRHRDEEDLVSQASRGLHSGDVRVDPGGANFLSPIFDQIALLVG